MYRFSSSKSLSMVWRRSSFVMWAVFRSFALSGTPRRRLFWWCKPIPRMRWMLFSREQSNSVSRVCISFINLSSYLSTDLFVPLPLCSLVFPPFPSLFCCLCFQMEELARFKKDYEKALEEGVRLAVSCHVVECHSTGRDSGLPCFYSHYLCYAEGRFSFWRLSVEYWNGRRVEEDKALQ